MEGLDLSGNAPKDLRPATARDRAVRILQIIAGIALAVLILGWGLPYLTHTTWPDIFAALGRLPVQTALLCLALMFLGLYCYTFALSASLPGLGHIPALIVNLCGSGVSNAMPGGGAVGAAAQYGIFRSWGFSHRNIGTSLIVASIWNLLIRMLLPLLAVAWLIASSDNALPSVVIRGALIGGILAAVLSGLLGGILASPRAAHAIGRALNAVIHPVLRLFRREHGQDIEALALDLRSRIIGVVRTGWRGLTLGIVGFLGVYAVLYAVCMRAFGIDMGWAQMFACYALSRLLTMVPLTPGGIGTTEVGPAALMVALGAHGPAAAAAVFLFAVYSHLLEIPFGALAGAVWAKTRRHYQRHQPEEETPFVGDAAPGST